MSNVSPEKVRILIVDDDQTNCLILKKMLSSIGNIQLADNGETALQYFRTAMENASPFDLVFLDIEMPGISGQEVLDNIRSVELEHGIVPGEGVRIVMVTADDDEKHIFDAHISGCDGYIVKPFSRAQIQEKLLELGFKAE